jgi:hypothetical protein
MIWQLRIGSLKFTFTMARVCDVVGVNSRLSDGNHILMWDFDGSDLRSVVKALKQQQRRYKLPKIYILNTGKPDGWHAYCFDRRPWGEAFGIVASTPRVDMSFLKYAAVRGHFTLRVTPKEGRKIKLACILPSPYPEKAYVRELKSWVRYETLSDREEVRMCLLQISRSGCAARISR